MKKPSRINSYFIITACYVAASMLGIAVYWKLQYSPWLSLLIADLVATGFIWLASLILKNASVYDPYWSVQPPIILGLTLIYLGKLNFGSIFLVLAVSYWGARLSINWMITFHGLHQQDWRYDQLERKSGQYFPFVNLFGIQVMPTLIVYACLLPGFYYIYRGGGVKFFTFIGFAVIIGGTTLEMLADYQMQIFRRQRKDRSCLIRSGLWRDSRHPNYLGEILVWWGVYIVMLSVYPDLWFLGMGPLLNTCLFVFISIPMAERHLATYKEGYPDYLKETRRLLPFPKRKQR
jgi:steroid 5-alpha reductase family enzyme